ncbi:MAG: 1-acyl-sn-glycerol-3-phosphate acyltransferase, partial [Pseudomonadota bacterium]
MIYMYGLLVVMGILWLPSLLMPRSAIMKGLRWYSSLVRWGLKAICGIRTEIRGRDNLPKGSFIYAAKHQ